MILNLQYSIKVYKQYFNFAASHFLIFENGEREPLHGHNYRVMMKGEAPKLESDMVFDFLDVKPIVREVCDSLDHRLLLPRDNQHLMIHDQDKSFRLTTPDESEFVSPKRTLLFFLFPTQALRDWRSIFAKKLDASPSRGLTLVFPL